MINIRTGDCRDILKTLPNNYFNCCVTSPPYFGLRDYGVENQIGLESNIDDYINNLILVFSEIKRVLKDDGTLWLNLGDTYSGNNSRASNNGRAGYGNKREGVFNNAKNIPPKNLIGIPWRVAFALQNDGWILRQDIIWNKPNPMPESVKDRCTKSHEYIFLLTKKQNYYFDNESIKEEAAYKGHMRDGSKNRYEQNNFGGDNKKYDLRNKRSVWSVNPEPFSEAHFATYPTKLIEPCILAGCPLGGQIIDPFGGAGTTGLVADRLERNATLIELNEDYANISKKRLENDAPLFSEINLKEKVL